MKPPARLFFNVVQMNSGSETIPIFIDEPDHFRRFGSSSDAKKAEAAFNNSLVSRSLWFSRRSLVTSATRSSGKGLVTRPSRRATCSHCRAVCHETPSFGAMIVHASCIDVFSAKIRSSTRRTTRSFASWSNFLGMFQIFPSTQTEQTWNTSTLWWAARISLVAV